MQRRLRLGGAGAERHRYCHRKSIPADTQIHHHPPLDCQIHRRVQALQQMQRSIEVDAGELLRYPLTIDVELKQESVRILYANAAPCVVTQFADNRSAKRAEQRHGAIEIRLVPDLEANVMEAGHKTRPQAIERDVAVAVRPFQDRELRLLIADQRGKADPLRIETEHFLVAFCDESDMRHLLRMKDRFPNDV